MIAPSMLAWLVSIVLAFSAVSGASLPGDIQDKPPDSMAKPLTAFGWKSKNDLRFVWWLPKDYDPLSPRNLTVICHGTGLDFRWGYWNNTPGVFRPNDIVVSVDGPTPDRDSRLFLGEKKDCDAFSAFLTEMRRTFAVDRVFLYGHSQGGFFVVFFAGEHPDQVAGVVAHASGAWNHSKTKGEVQKVAVAFMHGTSDPVVPYAQSPGSRDGYAKAGFEILHLRRLDRYNHWPNPVRATETLNWCQGMTATTPEEALECALDILRVKKSDKHGWTTVVGFSGARDVLRRIEKKGPVPFETVSEDVAAKAAEWVKKIDQAGEEHVAEIRKSLKAKKPPALDGGPWLGHLVPLREDFRGVESVEAFLEQIGYDAQVRAHDKAAETILTAWFSGNKDPKRLYEAVALNLGKAFLHDGFPIEIPEKMKEWHKDAKSLKLPSTAQKKYADFENWEKGWEDGLKEYAATWKKWEGP